MSKAVYVGVRAKAHKVKAVYVGVDGIARKVKKAYVGVNGKARLCYAANPFASYSGKYTVSDVEVDGKPCKLYTLTTSGTLVLDDEIQYWMCGGGASGAAYAYREGDYNYQSDRRMTGGGGGGGYIKTGTLNAGTHVVTIGAGGAKATPVNMFTPKMHSPGAKTSIGTTSAAGATAGAAPSSTVANPGASNGYSGGGGAVGVVGASGGTVTPLDGGIGDGNTALAYPFGLTSLKAHSAGGGAGSFFSGGLHMFGGQGGSCGSNGSQGGHGSDSFNEAGGAGGNYGGGSGGSADRYGYAKEGSAATFYGSGGGGAPFASGSDAVMYGLSGGAGYQGVVYLLAPV